MPVTINTYCRINRNGSININTDPAFGIITTTTTTTTTTINLNDYACISGPIAAANGTYFFTGDYYTEKGVTRPIYYGPNTYFIIISNNNPGPTWGLWNDGNGEPGLAYGSTTQPIPNYPWQASWNNGIIVTQGPC